MANLINLIIILALLVGGVFLQIFLSRKKNRWLGLILPAITFCYAVLMVFQVMVPSGTPGGKVVTMVVTTFLIGNVPTVVLLGIYFGCREKMKRREQVEKMNIQDL